MLIPQNGSGPDAVLEWQPLAAFTVDTTKKDQRVCFESFSVDVVSQLS